MYKERKVDNGSPIGSDCLTLFMITSFEPFEASKSMILVNQPINQPTRGNMLFVSELTKI